MKKIKIAHLVNGLGLDGTSKVVLDLCRVDPERYEIQVISLTSNLTMVDAGLWPPEVPVKAFKYSFDSDYSLRKYFWLLLFRQNTARKAREIIHYIREASPDIIHCHLQPRESLIGALAAQRIKAKLVLTDHSPRIDSKSFFSIKTNCLVFLYRRVYRHFYVVAVSKEIYKNQQKHRFFNRSLGHSIILNKIDSSRFLPGVKWAKHRLRVIYVARLEQRKGHDVLLRAWLNVHTSVPAELHLIGEGSIEDNLKEMIQGKELLNPVIFAGNRTNVLDDLQSADIAVFPSQLEGLSISLLEKMSCALPVIASDIPALKEVITDGVNGLLFKAGSAEDLQRKLEYLLMNETLRDSLGANARKTIVERFDSSGLLDDYTRVYQSLK